MPLPTLRETLGSAHGIVAAGGRAALFQDELKAEDQAAQQQQQAANLAFRQQQEQQRQLERQQAEEQRTQAAQAKRAEQERKQSLRAEVAKAEFTKSTIGPLMTDAQRAKAESDVAKAMKSVRGVAAGTLLDATAKDPNAGKTTGGFLGFGAKPTPEAQAVAERAQRATDPTLLTDEDLAQARALNPAPFDELDKKRAALDADAERRKKHQAATQQLARAKAIAAGVPEEELPTFGADKPQQAQGNVYNVAAQDGVLDRDAADLSNHEARLQRMGSDLESLRAKKAELQQTLQAGVVGPQSAQLHSQWKAMHADEQARLSMLRDEEQSLQAKRRAFEAKKAMHEEQLAGLGAPSRASSVTLDQPSVTPDAARQAAKPVTDAQGAVVAHETSQPDSLEALAKSGSKAFWLDPSRSTAPTPDVREASIKAANDSVGVLTKFNEERAAAHRELVRSLAERVRRGEIDPDEAQAEQDKAVANYEKAHEADAFAAGQKLDNALRDFQEGRIDSDTLNTVFHAAGQTKTGVEAFKDHLGVLRKRQEATDKLTKLIVGDGSASDDPGLNGQALALANEIAQLKDEGSYGLAKEKQAELAQLRSAHADKLRGELVKMGIDAGEHDAIIANAELHATRQARPGVAANIAAKGGVGAWAAEKLPFVGGVIEAARLLPYAETASKLERGETPSKEELDQLNEFVRFSNQHPTFAAMTVDSVTSLPGFAIELASTEGIANAVKIGGMKGLTAALKKMATSEGRELMSVALRKLAEKQGATNLGKRFASGLAQEAVRLPFASAGRVAGKYMHDAATQGVTLTPDETNLVATIDRTTPNARRGNVARIADAVADTFIENLSERSGRWLGYAMPKAAREALTKMAAPVKERLFKTALVRSLVSANPGVPVSTLSRVLAKANIGSPLSEMGEERVGDLARDLWKGVSTGQWGITVPTTEQLASEFVTFLVPGAKSALDVTRHFGKLDSQLQASDAQGSQHIALLSNPTDAAAHLSKALGTAIAPDEVKSARDLIGNVAGVDSVRDIDRAVESLMQKSNAAMQSGDLDRASKFRLMALEQSRTRPRAADMGMLKAVSAVRQIADIRKQAATVQQHAAALAGDLSEARLAGEPINQNALQEQQVALQSAQALRTQADRASALVKIARGRDTMLTAQEQRALGDAVEYGPQGSIITDAARDELRQIAPAAADYIKQSETQRREELANVSARAMPAQSSAGAVTGKAAAVATDNATGSAEGAAEGGSPSVAPVAADTPAQELKPGVNHGKGEQFNADQWKANALAQIARSTDKPEARQHMVATIGAAHEVLRSYGKIFEGGVEFAKTGVPGGLVFDPDRKALTINLASLATNTRGLQGDELREFLDDRLNHEVIHVAADAVLTQEQVTDIWKRLGKHDAGKRLMRVVERAYFAAWEARNEKPPAWTNYQAGHELLRMMVQDKAFAHRISEAVAVDKGLLADLRDFLLRIADWLNMRIAALPASDRTTLESHRDNVIEALRALGVLPANAEADQGGENVMVSNDTETPSGTLEAPKQAAKPAVAATQAEAIAGLRQQGLYPTHVNAATPPTQDAGASSRNTDLFPDKTDFMGKLSQEAVLSNYQEQDGFGVAEYVNPDTGTTDVYLAAFGDNDFIAYIRVYDENGKPTNRFTSKLERRSKAPGVTKKMLSDLQSRLPAGHEYTEDVSVSTDGLKFIAGQLRQGYEVALDESGKPLTQDVAVSGESIVNDLPIAVDPNGKFENIRITNRAEFDKVRPVLGKMLESFGVGLGAQNVRWENGTAFIDIPVLRKKSSTTATPAAETLGVTPPPAPAETPAGTSETPKTQEKPAVAATQADKKPAKTKDYSRYSAEQQALLRESDEQHAKDVAHAKNFGDDREAQEKKLKAAGMRHAARFRQITGKLTAKEQAAKAAYEASNHVGKAVSVDGVNGEIVGHAFGRVKVRLADGAVKTVEPDKIAAPINSNAAEGDQSQGGVVSPSGASTGATASSSFGAVADAADNINQPEATSNEIGQGRDNTPGEEVVYQAPEEEAPATPPTSKATKPKAERRKKIMQAINPPDEVRNDSGVSDETLDKVRKAFEGLGATERAGQAGQSDEIRAIGASVAKDLERNKLERVDPSAFDWTFEKADDPAFDGDGYYYPSWTAKRYEDKYLEKFVPLPSIGVLENGKFYIGDGNAEYDSLDEAKRGVMVGVREYLEENNTGFQSNMDGQQAAADVFHKTAHLFAPYASDREGWGGTKWGSWYFDATDDEGSPLKLSIRDHEATRKDMGLPDKSWEVSKNWDPKEVAEALVKALEWLQKNAVSVSQDGMESSTKLERQPALGAGQAAQSNSSSPGGLTEAEVKTPMTIYRAGDASEVGVKPFSSWSPDIETAKKYLDNPGFGGDTLRTLRVDAGSILDADTTNRPGMRKLAVALGFDAEKGDEWFDDGYRYPWEESSKVSQALKDSGFDAVRYKDDFPEGATTIIFTKEPKLIRSSFDTSAPALGAPVRASVQQTDLPRDRRAAFMDLADSLIKQGITEPAKLAKVLEAAHPDGRLRKYSQAMWNYLGTVSPELSGTHDWSAIYDTTSAPADDTKPSQSITGSNAETPAEMPVPETGEASPVDQAAHEAATSPLNDRPEPTQAQKEAGNYKLGHLNISGLAISVENPAGSERKGTDASGKPWSVTMADHYGYVRGTESRDGDHIDIFVEPGTPEDFAGPVFVVNQHKGGALTDDQWTDQNKQEYAEKRLSRIEELERIIKVSSPDAVDAERREIAALRKAIEQNQKFGTSDVIQARFSNTSFDEHKAVLGPSITTAEQARAEYLKNYSPGWKGAGDVVKFDSVAAFKAWATERQRRGAVRQETASAFSEAVKLVEQPTKPYTIEQQNADRSARIRGEQAVLEASAKADLAEQRRSAVTLVNLHQLPHDTIIAAARQAIQDRKDGAAEGGLFPYKEDAAAKRFRVDPTYINALKVVHDTLKAKAALKQEPRIAVNETPVGEQQTALPSTDAPQASEIDRRIADAEASGVVLSDADKAKIRKAFEDAEDAQKQANRLSGSSSDPLNKGTAFPMGVGFTRMTKRAEQRIDASVKKAGEAVRFFNKAKLLRADVEALLAGKGTEADKAAKADKRKSYQTEVAAKLLTWKKGDKIASFTIERVNMDRDGYPSSYTISGDGIVKGIHDKVDVVKEIFGGDKQAFRKTIDEARVAQQTVKDEVTVTTGDSRLTQIGEPIPPKALAAEVSTPEPVKESKPVQGPALTAQKKFLLEKIDDAIAEAPAKFTRKAGNVVIEVPGDGTFTIVNNKKTLREFKDMAKSFPTTVPKPDLPTATTLKASGIPALAKGKVPPQDKVRVVGLFASKDETRPGINFVADTGDAVVATDGRVLFFIEQPGEGSQEKPVFYKPTGGKTESEDRYPQWRQVVPKDARRVFSDIDTGRLWQIAKQASAVYKEAVREVKANNKVTVTSPTPRIEFMLNKDGSLGLRTPSYTADEINGSYEHNVTPGAESIGVLDADYVMEILRAMRALGSDSVNIGIAGTQTGRNTFTFDAGDAHAVVMEMAAPVDAPAQATGAPDTSDEYKQAIVESRKASAAFAEAQRAYRARQIDDDAFLAAKALHDAASQKFDEAAAKEQKRLQQKDEPASEAETTEPAGEVAQPGVLERAEAAGVTLPAKVIEGVKAGDAKLTANAEKVVAEAEAKPASGITDFGEKIGGARKDYSGPKTPRQPKAQKEAESQDPGWRKRYEVRQIVSSNKPGESGRWTITDLRTKDWTGQNRPATRETFATEEEANKMVPILAVARNHSVYSVSIGDGAPSGQAVANSIEANMKAINDLKEANRALLMGVDLTDRFKKSLAKGELTQQRYNERLNDGTILNDADYAKGKAIADQIRVLQETPTPEMQAKEAATRYGIFRNVTDRKRVQVVQETFPTRTDAMKYMATNAEAIIETKTSFGEEVLAKPEKVMREGVARRDQPADAKMFQDMFGFRGVEFGNWLRQDGMAGNERQDVLNHAYDGLLDLAEVLNIPPKAISLNGDLALAFGARGHGLTGAKAHYERDYGVINLTKMAGAGSLAHEWFHALDHYLGRLDGKASAERVANAAGNLVFQAKGRDGDYASHGFSYNSRAREELRQRYKDLLQGMFTKAEKFVEDTEKAERFVGASRQHLADEIKSVRDDLARQLDPKYYKRNNMPASNEQLEAFDTLAAKLIEGEDLDTTHRWTYRGDVVGSRNGMAGRFTNDTLEAMSAIYKAVRGRSGFNKDQDGKFDTIRKYMTRYAQRIAMLKSARDMETKEKRVPTDFAMNAKRIDQGRASDYWTTPHEMAARAFSAYVEDKLIEKGATSDFLSYGADNNLFGYRLLNIRPFPEGAERRAINELFDGFFGELKNRETDKGVELYATERPGVESDDEFAAALAELSTPGEAPFVPLSDEAVTKVRSMARDKYGADFTAEEAAQIAANLNAGIAGAYQEDRSRETHDAWIATAAKILQTDGLDASADELLADPERLTFNPVKVKLAQMVADQLAQRALLQRSPADRDKAERLMWAYNVTGTQAGRAVAARDHVHASTEELHRRAIANMIFTPPAHKRAAIEKAISLKERNARIAELESQISNVRSELEKTVAEMTDRSVKNNEFMAALAGNLNKARAAANAQVAALNKQIADLRAQKDQAQLLAEANQARIAAIESDLMRDYGLTLHDLFVSREALVRLRGSAIVKNALAGFNQKEALAQRLRMEGKSDRQISKQTGISEKALQDVFARVDDALSKQLEPWLDRGFSLGDFEQLDDQGNRIDPAKIIDDKGNLLGATLRAKITTEEKAARLKSILGAINSTTEARNTGALKRTARFGDGNNGFGFDLNRPEHAAMVARAIQRTDSNASDMIYEYWINGLLSGPATQTANIAGNTASTVLEFAIQRPLEAMINATLFRDAAGAQLGEYRSMAKYASGIFATAVNRAKRAWQTEINTFDAERLDQPLAIRGGNGKNESEAFAIGGTPGRVIRTPSRLLNFADEFAKYLVGGLEAAAQAHRLAKANGLTGEEFDKFVASQVNTNGSQAWLAAVDKAHRLTFTNELPDTLAKANNLLRSRATTPGGAVLKFFLRMVFPFVRTPYNIFATGLRKTPLGTLRMAGKATAGLVDSWKGARPFFDSYPKAALAGDMAEQLVGWVAALVLAGMAEGDPDDERKHILITGTRSQNDSRGEAQLLNRTRGGETTILVNGKPVFNYGRIEPFATVISTLVDAVREWKKVKGGEPPAKAIENATRALADQARSKTFLQGFDGLMQLIDGRTRSLPDAAVRAIVTGAVPNLVRQPLRNVDSFARDTRNAPWYYQALPLASLAEPLYDLYGRPIEKDFSPWSRVALGSVTTKVLPVQPADRALERWNKTHEGDPQQQYNPVQPSVFRFKDAQGKWQQMRPDVIAKFRRDAGRAFAADAIAQFASPTAPTAEEVRGLRSVKDRSYDATKKNLLGAGVQPPQAARPMPTLAELLGQRLR